LSKPYGQFLQFGLISEIHVYPYKNRVVNSQCYSTLQPTRCNVSWFTYF